MYMYTKYFYSYYAQLKPKALYLAVEEYVLQCPVYAARSLYLNMSISNLTSACDIYIVHLFVSFTLTFFFPAALFRRREECFGFGVDVFIFIYPLAVLRRQMRHEQDDESEHRKSLFHC